MCCGVKIRLQFKTNELKNKKPFTKKNYSFGVRVGVGVRVRVRVRVRG